MYYFKDGEKWRDCREAVLSGHHYPAIRLAREIMATPLSSLGRLEPDVEQALEDANGDLSEVGLIEDANVVEAALGRAWEASRT